MRKPLWIVIIFLALLLAFSITYIAIFDIQGLRSDIKDLNTELTANKEMLRSQNLELNALAITNRSLRLDVVDKDLEIIRLKAEGIAYGDMISILEYCVTYIHYLQVRMVDNGINYPEFIIKNILDELIVAVIEG